MHSAHDDKTRVEVSEIDGEVGRESTTTTKTANGCGRFSVLLGNFSLAFARFVVMVLEVVVVVVVVVMVVVDVWVALACVSFSSTAKRTEEKEKTNQPKVLRSQRSGGGSDGDPVKKGMVFLDRRRNVIDA